MSTVTSPFKSGVATLAKDGVMGHGGPVVYNIVATMQETRGCKTMRAFQLHRLCACVGLLPDLSRKQDAGAVQIEAMSGRHPRGTQATCT